jgi:tetratricopeptide (TPR) repeat protein
VVLIVDDVHAADNASVAILHMLARKLDGLRLLLILTARQGDVRASAAARALITDAGIETLATLELETLSHDAAAVLVARVSAKGRERWGEPPIAKIVRSSGGNPLALELLSREWVARGNQSLIAMLDALNALPAPALSLPQAVKAVYARQTQQLDDRSRAVLDLAAVLARRMGDLRFYQIISCSEGEALSRLTQLLETRLLREVAGQLEFRNELVRAHAYYEVPSTLRLELHRRVARLLERLANDQAPHELEIAWHYIIGRDPQSAARHALAGAERSLTEGAPREAELILQALRRDEFDEATSRQSALLLAAALMGQSKADEALPLLDQLLADDHATRLEIARAARLYASAMYLLNRNSTAKHSEMAERALQVARECDDKELLAHALFECGRAGVESGQVELTERAREELHRTLIVPRDGVPPIAFFADAYCSYFLLDIERALESAQLAVTGLSAKKNIGELALGYNALGNCKMAGCRFEEARGAYGSALNLWKRVGDDYRVSLTHYNLGGSHLMEGDLDRAIHEFERSLAIGRQAQAQPVLLWTWSSLALANLVQGRLSAATECLYALKHWIERGRSWAMNMEYYCGAAELELAMGNENEALMLIAKAEQDLQGRGYPFVSQGTLERLRVFFAYHAKGPEAAHLLAEEFMKRFKGRHQLAHLEVVAALAWIERKASGKHSDTTEIELQLFDKLGAGGKRAILAAQGFLV